MTETLTAAAGTHAEGASAHRTRRASIASVGVGLVILAAPSISMLVGMPIRTTFEARFALIVILTCAALGGLTLVAAFRQAGWMPASLPALFFSLAYMHHEREALHIPISGWRFRLLVALGALFLVLLTQHLARLLRAKHLAVVAISTLIISSGLAMYLYTTSQYVRWVILQHVNSIGAPLHLLLSDPLTVEVKRWRGSPEGNSLTIRLDQSEAPDFAPDVIFVLVDTLRADALPAWSSAKLDLPEFSRLEEQSLVFKNVLANSSWTRSSVASFFTGLRPEEHAARNRSDALAQSFATLAERFRSDGYYTAAIVSNFWAVGRDAGFDQGFDEFVEVPGEPYARAEEIVDKAVGLLREADLEKPCFIYLHFLDPHAPYLSGSLPSENATFRDSVPAYRAEVRYLDAQLSRLRSLLDESLARPYYLLLTSDHGEEFGEHGSSGHAHTLYSELLHIPALLSGPGIRHAETDSSLEARDFFDLLPELESGSLDPRTWSEARSRSSRYSSLYFDTPGAALIKRSKLALRRLTLDSYSLIWNAYGDTYELYDRLSDPGEMFNAASKSTPELVSARAKLSEEQPGWTEAVDAEFGEETIRQFKALGYVH